MSVLPLMTHTFYHKHLGCQRSVWLHNHHCKHPCSQCVAGPEHARPILGDDPIIVEDRAVCIAHAIFEINEEIKRLLQAMPWHLLRAVDRLRRRSGQRGGFTGQGSQSSQLCACADIQQPILPL